MSGNCETVAGGNGREREVTSGTARPGGGPAGMETRNVYRKRRAGFE